MHRVVFADLEERRAAATALAEFAVGAPRGRTVGDPVHEWVTEGRRLQYERAVAAGARWATSMSGGYSSCGDLAHWLLMCLGCRDERYVNRGDDGGEVPWRAGVNISRLVALPAYVDARRAAGRTPVPGDILHVASPDHVCVLVAARVEAGTVDTADYGAPHAAFRTVPVLVRGSVTMIGSRVLMGWVDLGAVEFTESALVPDSFSLGSPDVSPFSDTLTITPGVP